jgi:thiol-disulfide isomerase/thioredoxin
MNKLHQVWRHRWLRIVVEAILIVLVLVAVRGWMQRGMLSGSVPEFQGNLLNNEAYALLADRRRPLLIHFWATWCPVCKLEQESIQSISEDHAVITIAMQSGEAGEVTAYMRQEQLQFPVMNDPNGVLSRQFGVRAVPSSFIIDEDNTIMFRESGFTTEIGLRFRLWLAK